MTLSEYNRLKLGKQAKDLGFIRDTFEKVFRLTETMSFFEKDPVLSKALALKGGTAINLTIFNLPRLSVDIDLDYLGADSRAVSYTHLRAHETDSYIVCRLL